MSSKMTKCLSEPLLCFLQQMKSSLSIFHFIYSAFRTKTRALHIRSAPFSFFISFSTIHLHLFGSPSVSPAELHPQSHHQWFIWTSWVMGFVAVFLYSSLLEMVFGQKMLRILLRHLLWKTSSFGLTDLCHQWFCAMQRSSRLSWWFSVGSSLPHTPSTLL